MDKLSLWYITIWEKCDIFLEPFQKSQAAGRGVGGGGCEYTTFFGPQRGSHVDKQFCMYVETLPRSQTILYARLDDFLGRAAALRLALPEPLQPQASMVRAPADGPHPRRPWGLSIKEVGDYWYTTTSDMPKGHNTCKWLTVSTTELCGKSCLTNFCKVHLVRLRKGSRTQPCRGCGVGVTNKQQLCCQCGYRSEWRHATRATRKEFARLAAIEISI